MAATHSNKIDVNIFLDPRPVSRAGFSTVLLEVPLATNSLGGERVVTYANAGEAEDAQLAGEISATTLGALQAAFSQNNRPNKIKVGYVDVVGAETYATALDAIELVDPDFYGVVPISRASADQLAVSQAIEADGFRLCFLQSDDAGWLTTGIPMAWSAAAERERTAIVYHDATGEWADLCWACDRLSFDPDSYSAPWECQIKEVAAYTTGLTTGQRDFALDNKANLVLPFSVAERYVAPGTNLNGRRLYEILTADWIKTRIEEDIAYVRLQTANRGEKIIVDSSGQALILSYIKKWLQIGEAVGHFQQGQTRADGDAITQADRDANRLRFTVRATIAGDAANFTFNVYLSRSLVFEDAE